MTAFPARAQSQALPSGHTCRDRPQVTALLVNVGVEVWGGYGCSKGFPLLPLWLRRWGGCCWTVVSIIHSWSHTCQPVKQRNNRWTGMCLFKVEHIILCLFRLMIDRAIGVCWERPRGEECVKERETVFALEWRHSFAVGCVNMRKAFSAVESSRKSNIQGTKNNFFVFCWWSFQHMGDLLRRFCPLSGTRPRVSTTNSMSLLTPSEVQG